MLLETEVPLLCLAAVTVLYAAFDLFNKRNVPDIFAYASVVLGVIVTLVYDSSILLESLLIAAVIAAIGYVVYRRGLWGAGDYFELVAVSLLLPVQPLPFLVLANQFALPFILSVFIATGFAALWTVPTYYFLVVRRKWSRKMSEKQLSYGLLLFFLYISLLVFVYATVGLTLGRVLLILAIAIPSSVTMMFGDEITARMVERVHAKELEEGDIIAINMMGAKERKLFAARAASGRLVTKKLIHSLEGARYTLPVYKNAAPLAVFILMGVVVSLLVGNVVLFII